MKQTKENKKKNTNFLKKTSLSIRLHKPNTKYKFINKKCGRWNILIGFEDIEDLEILFDEVITQPLDDHVALSWCHRLFVDPKHT